MKDYDTIEHLKIIKTRLELISNQFLSQERDENDRGFLNLGSLYENVKNMISLLSMDEECDEEEEDMTSAEKALKDLLDEVKSYCEKRKQHGRKD